MSMAGKTLTLLLCLSLLGAATLLVGIVTPAMPQPLISQVTPISALSATATTAGFDGVVEKQPIWWKQGVVLSGTAQAWTGGLIVETNVLFDAGIYKMWYRGNDPGKLGYATSTDGIHWTPYASNPVLSSPSDIVGPTVIKDSGKFRLYASNSVSQIMIFNSTDGISWTQSAIPALTNGTSAQWDATIWNTAVWNESGSWHMIYEAHTGGVPWSLGLANSTDGVHFTKYAGNPVVSYSKGGTGAPGTNSGPWVTKIGSYYYMWDHISASGALPTQLGTERSSNLVTWTPWPKGPVLVPTTAQEGVGSNVGQVADPSLLAVGALTYLYYEGQPDQLGNNASIELAIANMTLAQLVTTDQGYLTATSPLKSRPGDAAYGLETISDNPSVPPNQLRLASKSGDAFTLPKANGSTFRWAPKTRASPSPYVTKIAAGRLYLNSSTSDATSLFGVASNFSVSGDLNVTTSWNLASQGIAGNIRVAFSNYQLLSPDGGNGTTSGVLYLFELAGLTLHPITVNNGVASDCGGWTVINPGNVWIRVTKAGSTWQFWYSYTGSTWTLDRTCTQAVSSPVYLGMALNPRGGVSLPSNVSIQEVYFSSGTFNSGYRTTGYWVAPGGGSITITTSGTPANPGTSGLQVSTATPSFAISSFTWSPSIAGTVAAWSASGSGTVSFTVNGLYEFNAYDVLIDARPPMLMTADVNGKITFSWSTWSTHTFMVQNNAISTTVANMTQIMVALLGLIVVAFIIGLVVFFRDFIGEHLDRTRRR